MSAEGRKAIAKKTRENLAAHWREFLVSAIAFGMLLFVAAGVSILTPFLGILVLCLLVLPYYFAFTHLALYYTREQGAPDNRLTFRLFGSYFGPVGLGCYRVILNLFKTFGISLLVLLISAFTYMGIAQAADPAFREAMSTIMGYYESFDYEGLNNYLITAEPLLRMSEVCSYITIGVAVFCLDFFLSGYALNPFMRAAFSETSRGYQKELYAAFYSTVRGEYRKLRFVQGIGGSFIVVVPFALGAVVGALLRWPNYFVVGFALGLSALALALVSPYRVLLLGEFFEANIRNVIVSEINVLQSIKQRIAIMPSTFVADTSGLDEELQRAQERLREYDADHPEQENRA